MKLTIKDNICVSVNKETGTPRFKLESPEIELEIAINDITRIEYHYSFNSKMGRPSSIKICVV